MSKFIDLIGQRFNKLIVTEKVINNKNNRVKWLCLCNCGKTTVVNACDLKSGHTKSCGCLKKELFGTGVGSTKHGHTLLKTKSKTYSSWCNIIARCTNSNNPAYKDHGGRGITICERWTDKKNGFINFLEDMGEGPRGLSVDRIDNNLGYYKENCHWINSKDQSINKRNTRLETFNNKIQCRSIWEEEYNLPHGTLHRRIDKLGWSIEKALITPRKEIR